jgi:hypothetical protein
MKAETFAEHWTAVFVAQARTWGAPDPQALGEAVFAEHRNDIITDENTERILTEIAERSKEPLR